jgi:hypothetical protein
MKGLENLSNIYLVNYLIKLMSDAKIEFAEEEKIKQEEKDKES